MKTLRIILISLSFFGFATISCQNLDLEMEVSNCIEIKIREIKRGAVQNPHAEVWEWKVDGKTYYYFTSDCCDQFNYLYDEKCNIVCAPDGGITGQGDGKCPEFSGSIEKKLVWKDNRK
jgi:hypothetical protein